MAHPNQHAKSSVKKFGGKPEDYIKLHEWLDETKGWFADSLHRAFRHHSEGIFELEKVFGSEFVNSDGLWKIAFGFLLMIVLFFMGSLIWRLFGII